MRYFIKRITSFFITFIMFFQLGIMTAEAAPEWPSDTEIMAEAGIVMDMDSKTVLFGQQIHVPFPPASITKLLTALVVAEHCSMDEIVTFSHDAVYNIESGSGNKLNMEEGDQMSVEDCLHMLLLLSSNQTANALAEHVASSRENFVEMMNQKVIELGCTESHFANPSGLNDDNQYVSAYDMALIAIEALKNEHVLRISSTRQHSIPPTIHNPEGANISMEHRLLVTEDRNSQYYCEGAVAGKTGYTSIAGNTLVTYAKREGRRLVSVILKGSQPQYYLDGKALLDFGFASFKNESVQGQEGFLQEQQQLEAGEKVYEMSQLRLEDAVITLPIGAEFSDAQRTFVTELPERHPEAAVGMLQYTYDNQQVGSAYLYDIQMEAELAAALASREAEEASKAEAENQSEESQEPEETSPNQSGSENSDSVTQPVQPRPLNFRQIFAGAAILGVTAATGTGIFIAVKRKKKEKQARELRRERRRERLQEIGYNEEDFEKEMRKWRESGADRKKKEKESEKPETKSDEQAL